MLPLVLGGVALAAVGYGLKEYCESEGCPWDDNAPTRRKSEFELLKETKVYLHSTQIVRLKTVLLKINKKFTLEDTSPLVDINYENTQVSKDAEVYVGIYKKLLEDAGKTLDYYTVRISMQHGDGVPYSDYSKVEKNELKKAYKFVLKVEKLLDIKLIDDKGEMLANGVGLLVEARKMVEKYRADS